METAQLVRDFVLENFYVTEPESLANDASLISLGVVDSTGLLEVICFLETRFDITVEDAETTPANLESIARIAAFVERKRASRDAATPRTVVA